MAGDHLLLCTAHVACCVLYDEVRNRNTQYVLLPVMLAHLFVVGQSQDRFQKAARLFLRARPGVHQDELQQQLFVPSFIGFQLQAHRADAVMEDIGQDGRRQAARLDALDAPRLLTRVGISTSKSRGTPGTKSPLFWMLPTMTRGMSQVINSMIGT